MRGSAVSPVTWSRPMLCAGAAAAENPGSSRVIPVTRPATSTAIGPTVSRLGDSAHPPSGGVAPGGLLRPGGAAEGRGAAHRPAVVGAVGDIGLAGGDGHRRAA